MSEWPKTADEIYDDLHGDLPGKLGLDTEVVPAYLARELYESSKAFYRCLDVKLDAHIAKIRGFDAPDVDAVPQEIRFKAALARYESEIGK